MNIAQDRGKCTSRRPSILVILRRTYLELVKGNHCAAKLIEYFKHWREWKLKHQRSEWIYMPLKWIHEDLMGEHSLHIIRAAIALLEKLKILEKRNNPDNGQDKTYQYKLNLGVLQGLLNSEHREFRSERSEFNAEQHTQDHYSIVEATTDIDAEPPEVVVEKVIEIGERNIELPLLEEVELTPHVITDSSSTPPPSGGFVSAASSLLEDVRSCCGGINPTLQKLVLETQASVVENAIAAYKEQKQTVKNPIPWMVTAIKNQYKPKSDVSKIKELDAFNAWYTNNKHRVQFTLTDTSITGLSPGQIGVMLRETDKWVHWKDLVLRE